MEEKNKNLIPFHYIIYLQKSLWESINLFRDPPQNPNNH